MERPFAVIYDPFTRSVETIRDISDLEPAFSRFRMEFSATTHAFDKLNLNKSSKEAFYLEKEIKRRKELSDYRFVFLKSLDGNKLRISSLVISLSPPKRFSDFSVIPVDIALI
ncbi:hypothetical protein NECAME_10138 [Necator americanus]|uniref:Uncharacterized protein n=1 Tax=Necator americanus TaxID=51031 RepID=W2TC86_NECAM|nr:hypothetical protein NECAME_10138 [Necator americanus]ETN78776.1 hypothetical protein NECAME_10138 [Necator americanus]